MLIKGKGGCIISTNTGHGLAEKERKNVARRLSETSGERGWEGEWCSKIEYKG